MAVRNDAPQDPRQPERRPRRSRIDDHGGRQTPSRPPPRPPPGTGPGAPSDGFDGERTADSRVIASRLRANVEFHAPYWRRPQRRPTSTNLGNSQQPGDDGLAVSP